MGNSRFSKSFVNTEKTIQKKPIEKAKAFPLGPLEVKVLPAGEAEYYLYSAAFKDGEKLQIVAQSQACTMRADSRVNLVAYDTDSATVSDRPPVKLQCFYELPQPPKVVTPDAGKDSAATPAE